MHEMNDTPWREFVFHIEPIALELPYGRRHCIGLMCVVRTNAMGFVHILLCSDTSRHLASMLRSSCVKLKGEVCNIEHLIVVAVIKDNGRQRICGLNSCAGIKNCGQQILRDESLDPHTW